MVAPDLRGYGQTDQPQSVEYYTILQLTSPPILRVWTEVCVAVECSKRDRILSYALMFLVLLMYARHRFPTEIISHCVWLYYTFPLSYRDRRENDVVSRD